MQSDSAMQSDGDYNEEFLEYSENLLKRFPALREIRDSDSPVSQREICDRCGVSKSTAHRIATSLTNKGILRKQNGGYFLTDLGEVLVGQTDEYVSKVELARENEDVLEFVLETGLEVKHLADGEVTRSSKEQPLAPLTRLAEATKEAEAVRALTNSVARRSFEVGRERVREGEQNVKMVVSARVVDSVRENGNGTLTDRIEKDIRTGNLRILVYEGEVPYRMAIMDDRLYLGASDENGIPTALLETENQEAVRWARGTFEKYKKGARPLTLP